MQRLRGLCRRLPRGGHPDGGRSGQAHPEDYCDGLGDCLPACPTGAISFEEREAPAYDEAAVKAAQAAQAAQSGGELPCGCPGSAAKSLERRSGPGPVQPEPERESQLSQWPVQIKLVPVQAPYFQGKKLLVAADCTAYAYAGFHERFIRDHSHPGGLPQAGQRGLQ